jgi:hypothetical protein
MTPYERRRLREAIDKARRAQLERPGRCRGCGARYDDHTPRCQQCESRMRKRDRRGTTKGLLGVCAGCGTSYDNQTAGCSSCYFRAWKRNNRKAA